MVIDATIETPIANPRRLPKQLKYWFAQIGVHPVALTRCWRRLNWFYGAGRSKALTAGCPEQRRHFRVLPHLDRMDICDGDMDRWANSLGASVSPIPRTEAEFKVAVTNLLNKTRKT